MTVTEQLPQIAFGLFLIGAVQLGFGFAGPKEWRASRWIGLVLLAGSLASCVAGAVMLQ